MRPCKGRYRHVQQLAKSASQRFFTSRRGRVGAIDALERGSGSLPRSIARAQRAPRGRFGGGFNLESLGWSDVIMRNTFFRILGSCMRFCVAS